MAETTQEPDANLEIPAVEDDGWSSCNSDYDEDTEEGREGIRRRQDRLCDLISKRIEDHYAQFKGPAVAYEIPAALYEKAEKQQADLADDERALLLSRGDVVGKALASPASLTRDEIHQALCWAPPDHARALVERVTGGELSEPKELFAKARQGPAHIRDDELRLIAYHFYESPTSNYVQIRALSEVPGNRQAFDLVFAQYFYPEGYTAIVNPCLEEMSKDEATLMRLFEPLFSSESTGPNLRC
jgi:hypothetical protein